MAKYDFSGWATKNDIRCGDGRIIRKDAFKDNDGETVPLVWNHDHNSPDNVLGHALLENRDEGVYTYCTLNDTDAGNTARELIKNGDITTMSIYANKLKQNGPSVMHGQIREVSLVLAGANPGALIDTVLIHSDEEGGCDAVIYSGEDIELEHSDEGCAESGDSKTVQDVLDTLNEEQLNVVKLLVGLAVQSKDGGSVEHSGDCDVSEDTTVKDVVDSMSEVQKKVLYYLVAQAAKGENKEDESMNHNAFEQDNELNTLTHSEMEAIFSEAPRAGSLKEACLAHGISDVEYLFPDVKDLDSGAPEIKTFRDMTWIDKVLNGVHHTPFSRIRSRYADLSWDNNGTNAENIRAKGYMQPGSINTTTGAPLWDDQATGDEMSGKHRAVTRDTYGNFSKQKLEEVFGLLRRTTGPTTIYKLQKMNRDDIVDITDFDVVAWIKKEMRTMLDEELAIAIMFGDGRANTDNAKIDENCIRPIYSDADTYTIKSYQTITSSDTDPTIARNFIKGIVRTRKNYFGSGEPTLWCTEDLLTEMLLLEDTNQHRLYKTEAELAAAMRVKDIVTIPYMNASRFTRTFTQDSKTYEAKLQAILVNLKDYNVGTDKGGAVNMFDDFDIDYNKYEYMIETRMSGALVTPKAAIRYETLEDVTPEPEPPTP